MNFAFPILISNRRLLLERLLEGHGVFADLGIEIFDDYWMNYRNRAMAKAEGFDVPPYSSLIEYKKYKEQGAKILNVSDENISTEAYEEQILDVEDLDE